MSSSGSPVRVLYVEDAFDQALLVKSFLQSVGDFDVVHSQDGDQAVRLLKTEKWDLLIADLNLPGTDGFDVIRAAKASAPSIPILATTGYTGAAYQEQAFRAGATDLLNKPLDRDEFLARVKQLLGGTPEASSGSAVVAVGGLVGDVEMGCGGTLLAARKAGHEVLIVPLVMSDDALDPNSPGIQGARRAAKILGADILLEEAAMDDTRGRVSLVELAVRDLSPSVVYVPAMDEDHPARREAFRIAKAATAEVPRVLGYQTATTGLDFKPDVFEDVSEFMVMKMESLAAYQAVGAGRLDLTPRMAQAYARYWGRFQKFTEVEVFETIRNETG